MFSSCTRFHLPVLCSLLLFASFPQVQAKVSFKDEIAPILVEKCIRCHDEKKNKGKYQVVTFEKILKAGDSGEQPIQKGKSDKSFFFQLLTETDEDSRMPAKSDPLAKSQIELIRKWIQEGANFDGPNPQAPIASYAKRFKFSKAPEAYLTPLPITALIFSPDGSKLLTSGMNEILIWKVEDGTLQQRIWNLPERIYDISFSPNDKLIAIASGTPGKVGEARILNTEDWKLHQHLGTFSDCAFSASFSSDNSKVAVASADSAVRVFDANTGKQTLTITKHSDWVNSIAFKPDGKQLITASRDKTAKVFDAANGELITSYAEHGAEVTQAFFSPDGKQAISSDSNGKIQFWVPGHPGFEESGGKQKKRKQKLHELNSFSGKSLQDLVLLKENFLACSSGGHIKLFGIEKRNELGSFRQEAADFQSVTYHEEKQLLAGGTSSGKIYLWDAKGKKLIREWVAVPGFAPKEKQKPELEFGRHIAPIFTKLGCNGGTCHGAVQGKNGFRLSLFGANPIQDHKQLAQSAIGRRINTLRPEHSLFLRKASQELDHEGGKLIQPGSSEQKMLLNWIQQGSHLGEPEEYQVTQLKVTPSEQVLQEGQTHQLKVEATFGDGTTEDVTHLCSFESRDNLVAIVNKGGQIKAIGTGDTSLIVRYRDEPVAITVMVPSKEKVSFPEVQANNFIDDYILKKLKRLNLPPAEVTEEATFLRRAYLDVTGMLPSSEEVRSFLEDRAKDKRSRKITELLKSTDHAALWTLKFCDILKASDFGVYADGLKKEDDAPRFTSWIRARLEENTPYDQLTERILTATSREGKSIQDWSKDVEKLYELSKPGWKEHDFYNQRKTLDLYWQRKNANGVKGTLQIAHSFLGLRLECAQCHRHPHDVWQQEDLLDFANYFMGVRTPGFRGENEKKYTEHAPIFKSYTEQGKKLEEEVKKTKANELKKASDKVKEAEKSRNKARGEVEKLKREIAKDGDNVEALKTQLKEQEKIIAEYEKLKVDYEKFNQEVREKERRSKYLKDSVAKRILHADIFHQSDNKSFAKVSSPLGTQESKQFRLLGEDTPIDIPEGKDPRKVVSEWLRKPDNPFFAKAIVNRVWAHYFGRGIIETRDDLSPLNPPSHPGLLDELCKKFIENNYDLRWLHSTILNSRTYQQSSTPPQGTRSDSRNYVCFQYRRLPAEVLLDVLDQVTETSEDMGMNYWRWPEKVKAVEAPYMPSNSYIAFMFEQFGKPSRNSASQCYCEREDNASILQVMSLANHPRVMEKIKHPAGKATKVAKEIKEKDAQIDELYLTVLSRFPDDSERKACSKYLDSSESLEQGIQGIMWSLLNTREMLLQH